jgi:transposase
MPYAVDPRRRSPAVKDKTREAVNLLLYAGVSVQAAAMRLRLSERAVYALTKFARHDRRRPRKRCPGCLPVKARQALAAAQRQHARAQRRADARALRARGWSIRQIAQHLKAHPHTVHGWVRHVLVRRLEGRARLPARQQADAPLLYAVARAVRQGRACWYPRELYAA